MKYYNKNTGKLVAGSEEELNSYYERTYKENVESGYINSDECSLEDWINSDDDIVGEE